MRILIPAVSSASQPTGICRHASNLARCLASRDEISEIILITRERQACYFDSAFELRNRKVRVVTVNLGSGSLARNTWYMTALSEVEEQYSPDLIHLSFPVPFVRRRLPCPVVTSLHDLYPFDIPSNSGMSRALCQRVFLRQCLSNSDAVVCVSDFTLKRLGEVVSSKACNKAVRIYQCVETRAFGNENRQAAVTGKPYLLSVAQHRSNKNLSLLIRAFAEFRTRNADDDLQLVIVGAHGPETSGLRRLIHLLSLERHVTLTSSITDSELSALYRNCKLFVAPSSLEGFGLPVVEALQCGARVLCSDIPVFREIGGDACWYFNLGAPSPAASLEQAMSKALEEPTRLPMGLHRFSSAEVASQYASLYARLLGRPAAATDANETASNEQCLSYDGFAS